MLIRVTRKTIVLGLAGLGIYKAWEIVNANLGIVREEASRVKKQLEPTVRQAETDVKNASHEAAETMLDASRIAVASVAEAVGDVALGGAGTEPTTPTEPSSQKA